MVRTNGMVKLAPSILSADFSRLGEQIREVEEAGADYIHVDVMDGHFVPNITIGPAVVKSIRHCTKLPFDVHLMIEKPENYIKQFADAGSNIITVHIEACPHVHRVIESIRETGARAGISLNPGTALKSIEEILPDVDLVLVMTVNPGFGGQKFIPGVTDKIARLRQKIDQLKLSCELEVDGGITADTAPEVVRAGAQVIVAGSAVFTTKETVAQAVARLKASFR